MNRRDFLHLLGIGAVSVAAPKIIFDMGKNGRIYTPIFPEWDKSEHVICHEHDNHALDTYRYVLGHAYFNDDGFVYIAGEKLTTLKLS